MELIKKRITICIEIAAINVAIFSSFSSSLLWLIINHLVANEPCRRHSIIVTQRTRYKVGTSNELI